MKRVIFSFASLIGALLVVLLVHLTGTGGDEPDLTKLPSCTATQTAADGCIPPEYARIGEEQKEVQDLAQELEDQS